MLPESTRQDSGQDVDDDDNKVDGKKDNNSNSGSMEVSPKKQIKNYTQRSQQILSEIDDLVNESSSLLKLDADLQLRSTTMIDDKRTNSDGVEDIHPFNLNSNDKNYEDSSRTRIIDINQRLIELNNELANVNEEIIALLENISDKYEKQKDFVNIAAHEIRSPCQAIIGYVDLLNLEPTRSKRYLNLISMNTERLGHLISNILDASRIDNKTLRIKNEKVNLIELLEKIIDDLNSRLANDSNQDTEIIFEYIRSENKKINKNTEVDHSKRIVIDADRGRITQVIFNLLDNAIRFGKGNKIVISLKIKVPNLYEDIESIFVTENKELVDSPKHKQHQQNQGEMVVVQVRDRGRGISPKVLDNLFTKFTSDDTTGGTGLGLFISKNIIEAHGGRIWAKNNEDQKGATFSFSLPLS